MSVQFLYFETASYVFLGGNVRFPIVKRRFLLRET